MRRQSIHDRIMSRPEPDQMEDPLSLADAPSDTRRSRVVVLTAAAVLLAAAGIGFLFYEFGSFGRDVAQNPVTQPQSQVPQPDTRPAQTASTTGIDPFSKYATEAGVRTCNAAYVALGRALTDGSQYTVQTQTAKTEPDRHSLQAVVGMAFKSDEYTGPAAGVVFAVPIGQSCEGTMVRVTPFPKDCQTAASLVPKGSTSQGQLSGIPVYALPTGGQVMLMPAGGSCVIVNIVRSAP